MRATDQTPRRIDLMRNDRRRPSAAKRLKLAALQGVLWAGCFLEYWPSYVKFQDTIIRGYKIWGPFGDASLSDSTTTAEQVYGREPTTRRNPVPDLKLWTPMRRQSVQNPHIVKSATQCNGRVCVWLVNQAMVGVAA